MTTSRVSQILAYDQYETSIGAGQSKRKSRGFSGVLRKLFGKEKKDKITKQTSLPPISKPTSFKHLSGASSRLVGTTVEERYAKAQSLPHGGTRRSPSIHALEKQTQSDVNHSPPRRTIQRRATLPKLVDSNGQWSNTQRRSSILDDGQIIDPADIGFAVTSGASFLKRRSRSAGALHTAMKQAESMPEVLSGPERRRSDDIRYWRASICPSHIKDIDSLTTGHDCIDNIAVKPRRTMSERGQVVDLAAASHAESVYSGKELDNRDTFDFGGFANTMQIQENISIEERVVTVEVKLMDLEYAISKLQSASTDTSTESQNPASAALSHRSHPNSEATSNSVSTQPTTASLIMAPDIASDPHRNLQSQIGGQHAMTAQPRSSLNALTIDHLNSLIGLIRREQAARHRLEDQIVELQRELKTLRQQVLPPSLQGTPFARQRGWSANQQSDHYDDTETDDGYQDTYQTPNELARAPFDAFREGAAF